MDRILLGFGFVAIFASQAALYFALPAGREFLPLLFLTLAFLPWLGLWALPSGATSLRARLLFSLSLPPATSPFLLIAVPEGGVSYSLLAGFWMLASSAVFCALGIAAALDSRFAQGRSGNRGVGASLVAALWALVLASAWLGFGFAAHPFSALSDLLRIDWIRDGELYFRVPSAMPVEYPSWRLYALTLAAAGALGSGFSILWRRR